MLNLIRKWLKAGVLENGKWTASEEGTPQGSSVSPLLANIYLHYVLDLWVQAWRRLRSRGDVIIVRWADDFVVGFQYEDDGRRFLEELRERFQRFSLELHPEKTRLIRFGRFCAAGQQTLRREAETRNLQLPRIYSCLWGEPGREVSGPSHHYEAAANRQASGGQSGTSDGRCTNPSPSRAHGCSRWFEVTLRITPFQVTGRHWGPFGPSAPGCGIEPSAAGVRKPDSPGSVWRDIAETRLPPARILHPWPEQRLAALIRGKSRMRKRARADLWGRPRRWSLPRVCRACSTAWR